MLINPFHELINNGQKRQNNVEQLLKHHPLKTYVPYFINSTVHYTD